MLFILCFFFVFCFFLAGTRVAREGRVHQILSKDKRIVPPQSIEKKKEFFFSFLFQGIWYTTWTTSTTCIWLAAYISTGLASHLWLDSEGGHLLGDGEATALYKSSAPFVFIQSCCCCCSNQLTWADLAPCAHTDVLFVHVCVCICKRSGGFSAGRCFSRMWCRQGGRGASRVGSKKTGADGDRQEQSGRETAGEREREGATTGRHSTHQYSASYYP